MTQVRKELSIIRDHEQEAAKKEADQKVRMSG
jgi:hypothetical protein